MESIIAWVKSAILKPVPVLDLSSLPAKPRGKLRLSPEQLLSVIQAPVLAEWALMMTRLVGKPRLPRGPGGRPATYPDSGILLMSVVQTTWRKSYEQIVDYVASQEALALALGFTQRTPPGKIQTISKGQYWERRAALDTLPFLFFFLALVAQLIRLGAITGKELIVDSTLLEAWWKADPGAAWQQYAGKAHLFGYKVHTVLCRQANLPVFVLVTQANVHDSLVGWFILLVTLSCMASGCWSCTPMPLTSNDVSSGSSSISLAPMPPRTTTCGGLANANWPSRFSCINGGVW